ncbi:MAG: glycoside hydrolase family 30 protein [Bacillota bacterium]
MPLKTVEPGGDKLELTGVKYQKMEGFGGCFNELGWIALSHLDEGKRREVFDEFFGPNGCRFNICRLPVGANDYAAEWYSHDENDGDFTMDKFSIDRDRRILIPYIKEALKRAPDLKLFASPWSPPTWFKFPKAHNYGKIIWKKEYLDAYALYFVKFVQAYRDEGVTIHQIHIQNEPCADQKFPSCLWTGGEMRDFIRDYLGPAFERNGLATEIWLGTINSAGYDEFANTVLSDPEARRYVAGVGYQWDGKGAVQRTYESWPEIKLMQTENECGDGRNTWEYAVYIFTLFRHYIANGAGAYIYWNMVLETGGMSTWGWKQNSMLTVDPERREVMRNPEFYVMKHFSHFVKRGAVRLGVKGHWAGNSVAFGNPGGGSVAVVYNPFPDARTLTLKDGEKEAGVQLAPGSFNTFAIKSDLR